MDLYKVFRSDEASADLYEIADYIASDNPYQAIAFIEKLLESAVKTLSVFPQKHPKYKDCFMWPFQDYLVFFDINESSRSVEILMITHASQYSKYKHLV